MYKQTRNKLFVVAITAFILVGGSIYFMIPSHTETSYATETVQRGDIENSVLAIGMLQASKLVSVGSQASGQVIKLPVALGEQVKKGDLIAEIDSLTQQNSLKVAKASLNSTKAEYRAKEAQIRQAQQAFERQKSMFADNASSKADYETAQADLEVYQAQLEQLQSELEQQQLSVENAQLELDYTTIKAPMDGVLVYNSVVVGQTVNASQTTPTLVELADLQRMTIKAQISEADVINVKSGQAVYFTILGQPNKRYNATLRAIEPGPTSMDGDDVDMEPSDSDAVYYNGLFEVDNEEGFLRIGMTAQVSIVLNQAKGVIIVPAQVLQKKSGRGAGFQVPVLNQGGIEYRDVSVGISNKINAEITQGLEEGEQIVLGVSSATATLSKGSRRPPSPMGF
jgi:macrolide-specific efflux system membrane fusion protein